MTPEKIETIAENILTELRVSSLPIPVEEIASKKNIKIGRAPSKDFSGMLVRKDKYALIGVNSKEAPVRQRFTIAHELGHFFLHPRKYAFVDYRDNQSNVMRTPEEKQANMFAAALLMPKKQLQKDYRKIAKSGFDEEGVKNLAEKYLVSEDAMRFRLLNLELSK